MTDARIPERYLMDRRIVRLTDTQRSSYFMATLWSVSNRTDGFIDRADLPLIPTFNPNAAPALVDCGLWAVTGSGWTDTEFMRVQTSRDDLEVLENARRADREKKARARAAKKGNPPTFPGNVPGTSPGDSTGEDRTGKDRQGQDEGEAWHDEHVDSQTGEITGIVTSWPVAAIPADPGYCTHGMTVGMKCRQCPTGVAQVSAA